MGVHVFGGHDPRHFAVDHDRLAASDVPGVASVLHRLDIGTQELGYFLTSGLDHRESTVGEAQHHRVQVQAA